MTLPSIPYRRSLRFRLVFAFVGLLAVVVAVFSWAAWLAAYRGAVEVASGRVSASDAQLAELLGASIGAFLSARTPAAGDPRVVATVAVGEDTREARAFLDSLAADGGSLRAVSLHDAAGRRIVFGGADSSTITLTLPEPPDDPGSPWVSGFRESGPRVLYSVVLPVDAEGTQGWLAFHATLTAGPQERDRVTGLIGDQAALRVGTAGGLWTDLVGVVTPPPTGLQEPGAPQRYATADGRDVFGVGARVPGTPWTVRVELAHDAVVAGPRALLVRLVALGLLLLAAGAVAAWTLTRGVVRRVDDLADGAAAIAAGRYDQRVPETGEDELAHLARAFNTMAARVDGAHERLERSVAERTAELSAANQELEAFSYSVSHDLRAPLRAIHGFSRAVLDESGPALGARGREDLERVCAAAERMGQLIDEIIELARTSRLTLRPEPLDLSAMAGEIVDDLRRAEPGRSVEVRIDPALEASGDRALVHLVLRNLFENAWKFTGREPRAVIEFQRSPHSSELVVRDNGAGFDPAFAHKLFQPFQRLHSMEEFAGSGVGLAMVARILRRHGGRIRAEGALGRGAAFHFTLPGGAA